MESEGDEDESKLRLKSKEKYNRMNLTNSSDQPNHPWIHLPRRLHDIDFKFVFNKEL